MKHRILKKFVKAYQPYGKDCKGVLLGIKEEGKYKYWHRGAHLRWWTHIRNVRRKYVRRHPNEFFTNHKKIVKSIKSD